MTLRTLNILAHGQSSSFIVMSQKELIWNISTAVADCSLIRMTLRTRNILAHGQSSSFMIQKKLIWNICLSGLWEISQKTYFWKKFPPPYREKLPPSSIAGANCFLHTHDIVYALPGVFTCVLPSLGPKNSSWSSLTSALEMGLQGSLGAILAHYTVIPCDMQLPKISALEAGAARQSGSRSRPLQC
jgi:hypothetical protein